MVNIFSFSSMHLTRENAVIHFFVVSLAAILTIKLLDLAIRSEYQTNHQIDGQTFQTSIWCFGKGNHNERKCRAINICYESNHDQFLFINGPSSIQSGLPSDLYSPCIATLSSVRDHNQYYFNYVTIDHRFLSNLTANINFTLITKPTLIFGRFKPDNLMHSLHDDIIPLLWTLLGLGWYKDYTLFAFDSWPAYDTISFNRIIYRKLFAVNEILDKTSQQPSQAGVKNPLSRLICFKEAWFGLDKETVWYQYGFRSPQGPVNYTGSSGSSIFKVSEILRKKFSRDGKHKCPKKVYGILLSRLVNRKLLNQREIVNQFSSSGIPLIPMTVDLNADKSNSLLTVINKVICAQLLIGVHGSGLILSIFLPTGSHLIELFPYGIEPDLYTPYKTLASNRNLIYHSWVNSNISHTITHPEYPAYLGGIEHLPKPEQSRIKQLGRKLDVHLCCNDPNWLFRIYQDTKVDIDDFSEKIGLDQIAAKKISSHHNSDLSPGPVMNSNCSYSDENNGFMITWEDPWNLNYNRITNQISYEILVDNKDGTSLGPLFTSSNLFHLSHPGRKDFLVWIRCQIGKRRGPFHYILCVK
ncbi:protein O-linked-mannose beta-1,4-N-acetylglucosaminyltransferase 2-like [Brevipalpus obovatus]|uniref:protein O-linked-mannose beta-1,4-N-acetylglucosaminyltransferase 2-like n=1 Tax=Brevipalpus obovatus TaxID=246614 RepID=UPI003D9EC381